MIDAGRRRLADPVWLQELGLDAPRVTRVRGVTYVTRMYRRDQKQLDGRFGSLLTPYPGRPFGGAALRQEGERWVVLLAGMVGTEPPLDEDGMIAFAEKFASQDIAAVMRESTPLTEPLKYTYPESTRRHYEKLGGLPDGLLVVGDAYCGFNPIYGQGITVAALEALILRRLLSTAEDRAAEGRAAEDRATEDLCHEAPAAGLARDYFQAAGKLVDEAWETSAASDLRFPEVEGERRRGAGLINAYGEKFRAAASVDPALGETFLRVANMADKPARLRPAHRAARLPVGGEGGTRGAGESKPQSFGSSSWFCFKRPLSRRKWPSSRGRRRDCGSPTAIYAADDPCRSGRALSRAGRHPGSTVAPCQSNDLGNFALPGDKARVARVKVPCNAEFPRYGHGRTASAA